MAATIPNVRRRRAPRPAPSLVKVSLVRDSFVLDSSVSGPLGFGVRVSNGATTIPPSAFRHSSGAPAPEAAPRPARGAPSRGSESTGSPRWAAPATSGSPGARDASAVAGAPAPSAAPDDALDGAGTDAESSVSLRPRSDAPADGITPSAVPARALAAPAPNAAAPAPPADVVVGGA